jgi:hypothetical protein
MRRLALIVLAACGSPATRPEPIAPSGAPQSHQRTDPQASRDGVLKAAFAALSAGDLDGVMRVAYTAEVFERAVDCPYRSDDPSQKVVDPKQLDGHTRDSYRQTIGDAKGTQIEVLGVDSDSTDKSIKRGGSVGGVCTATLDIEVHELVVRLRVQRAPFEPHEGKAHVTIAMIEGRWLLSELPPTIDDGDDARATAAMVSLADKMCACKDAACAAKIDGELEDWGTKRKAEVEAVLARRGNIVTLSNEPDEVANRKTSWDAITRREDCRKALVGTKNP